MDLRNSLQFSKKENNSLSNTYENKIRNKDSTITSLENEIFGLKTNIEDSCISRLKKEIDYKNDEINLLKSKLSMSNEQLKE